MKRTNKKIVVAALTAALASSALAFTAFADDTIKILVNGSELNIPEGDTRPFIENDRTLVPMRAIFEALGADVQWDGAARRVTAHEPVSDVTVVLDIDSKTMLVNGEAVELDVPAKIANDRTVVPVRAIAEGMKCVVDWDGDTRTVIVEKGAPADNLASYGGIWHDTVNEGVTLSSEGTDDPNVLYVTITRANSDGSETAWTMNCKYDSDGPGRLLYSNGIKSELTFNENGLNKETKVWEDGNGIIEYDAALDVIHWADSQDEGFSVQCKFKRAEDPDSAPNGAVETLAKTVWAANDADGKLVMYFEFTDENNGKTVNTDGIGVPFTWEANGDDVVLHMGSADDNSKLIPLRNEDGSFTMTIDNGTTQNTYTFVKATAADIAENTSDLKNKILEKLQPELVSDIKIDLFDETEVINAADYTDCIFADLDNDGKDEFVLMYSKIVGENGGACGAIVVYKLDGDKAEKLAEYTGGLKTSNYVLAKADGKYYLEHVEGVSGGRYCTVYTFDGKEFTEVTSFSRDHGAYTENEKEITEERYYELVKQYGGIVAASTNTSEIYFPVGSELKD